MPAFDHDRQRVIERAGDYTVKYLFSVSSEVSKLTAPVELAALYEPVFAIVGVHPHDASSYDEKVEQALIEALGPDKVVALGETGLDYHYKYSPPKVQVTVFRRQLEIALEHDLPVVIHSRKAEEETVEILSRYAAKGLRGVVHCFSGNKEMSEKLIHIGFYISFTGSITYPKSGEIRDIAERLPRDRVMIETDAPFLAPQSRRGKRNEPAYVIEVAELLSKLWKLSLEQVARITSNNAGRLFFKSSIS